MKWRSKNHRIKSQAVIFPVITLILPPLYLHDSFVSFGRGVKYLGDSSTLLSLGASKSNIVSKNLMQLNVTLLIFCVVIRWVWEIKYCCMRLCFVPYFFTAPRSGAPWLEPTFRRFKFSKTRRWKAWYIYLGIIEIWPFIMIYTFLQLELSLRIKLKNSLKISHLLKIPHLSNYGERSRWRRLQRTLHLPENIDPDQFFPS